MNDTRHSSTTHNHNNTRRNIETSLEIIQSHCNHLLSHYHRLLPQQAIASIEVIENQNFLLQEMFADIASSSQIVDKGNDKV